MPDHKGVRYWIEYLQSGSEYLLFRYWEILGRDHRCTEELWKARLEARLVAGLAYTGVGHWAPRCPSRGAISSHGILARLALA